MIDVQFGLAMLSGDSLSPNPRLLFGEQFRRDLLVVVSLEELLLLGSDLLELFFDFTAGGICLIVEAFDIGLNICADLGALSLVQFNPGVGIFDGALDRFNPMVGLGAVAVLPTGTDEVFVGAAIAAGGSGVDQAMTTAATEDGAAQVVVVPPAALTGGPLTVKHFLDALECRLVDELGMTTFADLAVVANDSDVVVVAQHGLDAVSSERNAGLIPPGTALKANAFEDSGQLRSGVVAGAV